MQDVGKFVIRFRTPERAQEAKAAIKRDAFGIIDIRETSPRMLLIEFEYEHDEYAGIMAIINVLEDNGILYHEFD